VAEDVRKEVVGAYYPSAVSAADATRSRAQNAYAVAAAIATALVTAGALTHIGDRSPWVRGFGLAAVMGWIATALIFMLAIGGKVDTRIPEPSDEGIHDTDAWVAYLLADSRARANIIGGTIDKGWITALVASALTVVAIGLGVFLAEDDRSQSSKEARVVLSPTGQKAFSGACPNGLQNKAVEGVLDIGSLGKKFALITVPATACGLTSDRDIEVRIPPSQILGYSRAID
jgi:hypothetical protein